MNKLISPIAANCGYERVMQWMSLSTTDKSKLVGENIYSPYLSIYLSIYLRIRIASHSYYPRGRAYGGSEGLKFALINPPASSSMVSRSVGWFESYPHCIRNRIVYPRDECSSRG